MMILLVAGATAVTPGEAMNVPLEPALVVDTILTCPAVSAGAGGDDATRSVVNVGQAAIGSAAGGSVVMRAGVIPCYVAVVQPVPGDCDVDGDVDLFDYACFFACVTGSGGGVPSDCETYDFDMDNDVDLVDWGVLQAVFTGW